MTGGLPSISENEATILPSSRVRWNEPYISYWSGGGGWPNSPVFPPEDGTAEEDAGLALDDVGAGGEGDVDLALEVTFGNEVGDGAPGGDDESGGEDGAESEARPDG